MIQKEDFLSRYKKLTILHSNDLHGDFVAQKVDDKLLGGVSRLSGYIRKVRSEEENVLYTISGDMFRGSVIDSEYRGISTIEIMNMLGPDVATLGNHEVDYGIGHLLFLEKCARFPIINANLYLKTNQVRLFKSHVILEIGGMRIMFIGILTEEVLAQARQERLVGSFVDVHEAALEVGKICNTYRTQDIDFTVLLTHIGFEQDKELAKALNPNWGIDVIIGGHSHTLLQEPCVVAGIPIVQAATGTDQVGRFDLEIDTDTNSIHSCKWQLVPIDDEHCPRDLALEELIGKYQDATDAKYARYITRFADTYTHPARNQETQLGRLFSDVIKDALGLDIMMFASGSLRNPSMGPLVNLRDLTQMFPFHDEIFQVPVNGKQLKGMISYLFRPEAWDSDHSEYYQFSRGVRFEVSTSRKQVRNIRFCGEEIDEERLYHVGLQGYHFKNMADIFGITEDEVKKNGACKILSTNVMDILDETFSRMELVVCPEDPRWIYIED